MKATSLRWRLVMLAGASIFAALTIAGVLLGWIFERQMERRINRELGVRLEELLADFELDAGAAKVVGVLADPRYEQPMSGVYWQIFAGTTPALQSRSLWDQSLAPDASGRSDGDDYQIHWADGAKLYVRDRAVILGPEERPQRFRVAVGLDSVEVDAMSHAFSDDVIKALAAIGLALFAGSWLQINLGLRPLAHLRRSLAAIRAGRAAQLEGSFPLEVAPLTQDFNNLLLRHAESLRKARERAGSLAHGLKTPLTIMSGQAASLESKGLRDAAMGLREQIGVMRRHVERELARSRSHGLAAPGELHTDAQKSVDRLIDLLQRMPRGDAINWTNQLPAGLSVQIDPDDFGEIFGNLLDNARKFSSAKVVVDATVEGRRAKIFVDDDGPGIPAALRETLLQRGARADVNDEGSGLGFSIIADLLAEYGAELMIEEAPGGGCRVSVTLFAPAIAPTLQAAGVSTPGV